MIAALNDAQKVWRFHLCSHTLQQIERSQRVACTLHKENRRSQRAQNFVAKFCAIAHGTKRIAKANKAVDLFFERYVTSNSSAHAFAH